VAGDTVEMRDGAVLRNGNLMPEEYVVRTQPRDDPGGDDFRWQRDHLVRRAEATVGFHPSRNNWGPLVVPEQSYFVLGDNRDNSHDSRYWGFVPDSLVKGRPMLVYYSYEQNATDPMSWLTNVRWARIGHRIR
jgi:signal peptidase I